MILAPEEMEDDFYDDALCESELLAYLDDTECKSKLRKLCIASC